MVRGRGRCGQAAGPYSLKQAQREDVQRRLLLEELVEIHAVADLAQRVLGDLHDANFCENQNRIDTQCSADRYDCRKVFNVYVQNQAPETAEGTVMKTS